jgi:hypothetical protein
MPQVRLPEVNREPQLNRQTRPLLAPSETQIEQQSTTSFRWKQDHTFALSRPRRPCRFWRRCLLEHAGQLGPDQLHNSRRLPHRPQRASKPNAVFHLPPPPLPPLSSLSYTESYSLMEASHAPTSASAVVALDFGKKNAQSNRSILPQSRLAS